jgi:ribonuclease PH
MCAAQTEGSSTKRRPDGRTFDQLRPIICEQRLVNRADGSARVSAGKLNNFRTVWAIINTVTTQANLAYLWQSMVHDQHRTPDARIPLL